MASVEVLPGRERRRWSEEQKRSVVAAAFEPGAVVRDVARQADVTPSLIYRWRRDLQAIANEEVTPFVSFVRAVPDILNGSSAAFQQVVRAERQLRNALMDGKMDAWGRHYPEEASVADQTWVAIPKGIWRRNGTRWPGNTLFYDEGRSRYSDVIVERARMLELWPSRTDARENATVRSPQEVSTSLLGSS
jgi:transposase-like protein